MIGYENKCNKGVDIIKRLFVKMSILLNKRL